MITLNKQVAVAAGVFVSALLAGAAGAESLPPSPAAEALRVEVTLDYGAKSPVRAFYEARGYRPFWLSSDGTATPAARSLLLWAGGADANGLPTGRYGVHGLSARVDKAEAGSHSTSAALEVDLTHLFLSYGRDLTSGVLTPRDVSRNIDIDARRPDPAALLAGIAAAQDVKTFLASLKPSAPAYDRQLALYQQMREIAKNGDWGPTVAGGDTLRPGDRSDRIVRLRQRLIAIGDLSPTERVATSEVMSDARPAAPDPSLFDAALEAAVKRFQARHGLNTDGVVGPMTLGAINTSAAKRAKQAAVGLERLRWLNYDLGRRHIVINTAAFTMTLLEDGKPRFATRTVVGKAGKFQTPEFNDALEFIVVNPYWNVPYSIATKEILPLLQEDPTYLEQNNMELLGSDLPSSLIDWTKVTRGSFPGRLRQRPGDDNALGAVKFLFPNKHSIYMHDTPARRLFARDRRDYSHGCVRLEDPIGFAHLLLSLQVDDPAGTFDRLRATPGEQWITIEQPIPVYVTYRTAWRDDAGEAQFRADVYRRDQDVLAALEAAGVSAGVN